jgi:hypothetical protein
MSGVVINHASTGKTMDDINNEGNTKDGTIIITESNNER